jgi:glycerol-3-phosphate acyltransferase PlsY
MATAAAIPLVLIFSYLIGSIDFAVVISRMHGVDIHNVGSGNPGTANVLRSLGRGPAVMVFVGDTLKGVIAAAAGTLAGQQSLPESPWALAAGLAAVAGHCYPIFHGFKGGKGVATAGGAVLFTVPVAGLVLAVVWVVVARLTKTASIASLVVVASTGPLAFWQGVRGLGLVFLFAILALVVFRHRGNISRISGGDEQKVAL